MFISTIEEFVGNRSNESKSRKIRHWIIIVYKQLACVHDGKSETEDNFELWCEREDTIVSYDSQFNLIKKIGAYKLKSFAHQPSLNCFRKINGFTLQIEMSKISNSCSSMKNKQFFANLCFDLFISLRRALTFLWFSSRSHSIICLWYLSQLGKFSFKIFKFIEISCFCTILLFFHDFPTLQGIFTKLTLLTLERWFSLQVKAQIQLLLFRYTSKFLKTLKKFKFF